MANAGAGIKASASGSSGAGSTASGSSGAGIKASASGPSGAGIKASAAGPSRMGFGSAASAPLSAGAAAPGAPGAGILASAAGPAGFGVNASAAVKTPEAAGATELTALLKHKSGVTSGYNATQLATYNKEMLSAVPSLEPLVQSNVERLTLASAVPGALGKLPPSGTDSTAASSGAQMTDLELQRVYSQRQAVMQTMSNISKQMHDQAKAIINNLRG